MENITPNKTIVPKDLQFVLQKDICNIEKSMIERYAQSGDSNVIQSKIKELNYIGAESLSKSETFVLYEIDEKNLFLIYEKLERKARGIGVNVEYVDMTGFSEDTYYENNENEETKHAETARSDGKNLLLEKDLQNAGGIQGRTYDLLHLAFGHLVQWSSDDKSLLLTKEEAWSIGYRNHEGSPDIVIDMMSLYEFEAGMLGLEALRQVLDNTEIYPEQKEKITQYFTDYVYADRAYIIQHYRGNHESFQKFWKFGQPVPSRQSIPNVKEFIKRHAVEIGLIQDIQEK